MSGDKVALTVLGMHRSGTSMLTSMVQAMGWQAATDLMVADQHNPEGYWESRSLNGALEAHLLATGSSWHDWRKREPSPADETLSAAMTSHVREQFGNARRFVAKDPRLCLRVDLWNDVLIAEGIRPLYVIITRSPPAVFASLAKRNGMPLDKAALLWMRYVKDCEVATRSVERVIVDYNSIVADPASVASTLSQLWPDYFGDADERASVARVKDTLNRSDEAADQLDSRFEWPRSTYKVLEGARGLTGALDVTRLDAIYAEFEFWADKFAPYLTAVETKQRELAVQVVALTRELDRAKWTIGNTILANRS